MKFSDLTNRLSEKQRERLRNAKAQEDLDELFTPDKLLLTEDQLSNVAGGNSQCWRTISGEEESDGSITCPNCGYSAAPGETCICGATENRIFSDPGEGSEITTI